LGIHPFYSPLPKAQNRKSYFALFYKKEDQKETNNKVEKKLHRLTRHNRLHKIDSNIFHGMSILLRPNFVPFISDLIKHFSL